MDLIAGVLRQPRGRTGSHGAMVARVAHYLPAQLDGQPQSGHAQHATVVILASRTHKHLQLTQEAQFT